MVWQEIRKTHAAAEDINEKKKKSTEQKGQVVKGGFVFLICCFSHHSFVCPTKISKY